MSLRGSVHRLFRLSGERQRVTTQPDKISLIRGWPDPTNVKQVRSFLGVCGFYQRFIPSYAKTTAPLPDLLKKDCVWSFAEVHRASVARLKLEFERSAVLAFPDHAKEYIIHLDASDFAVGVTLYQADATECVKLVVCMSKKLNPAECNYPTHEREFLALVQALKH